MLRLERDIFCGVALNLFADSCPIDLSYLIPILDPELTKEAVYITYDLKKKLGLHSKITVMCLQVESFK